MTMPRLLLVLAVGFTACKKTDTDPPTDTEVPTDTDVEDPCGDGELDDGEDCDLGTDNGAGSNCLEDCTAAPLQNVIVPATSIGTAGIDAQAVTMAGAPAGSGAWAPSDSDLGSDGLAKFEFNVPLYDFTADLTPTQFEALEQSPYQPPASWLGEVLLSELAEISFWTNTPAAESGNPYFLVLYTQPDGVDDTDWFGYRLTAVPSAARNVVAPGDTWVKWTVSGSENLLAFADQPTIGTFTGPTLPTLPEIQASNVDWSSLDGSYPSSDIDYAGEVMRFVSFQTGSGTDTTHTDAAIDLLEITLTDGRSIVIDLEP